MNAAFQRETNNRRGEPCNWKAMGDTLRRRDEEEEDGGRIHFEGETQKKEGIVEAEAADLELCCCLPC